MRVNTRIISLHNGLPAAEGPRWKHVALAYVARGISVPIHSNSMVGAVHCGAVAQIVGRKVVVGVEAGLLPHVGGCVPSFLEMRHL